MEKFKNYKQSECDMEHTIQLDSMEQYYKRQEIVDEVITESKELGYEGWMSRLIQKMINSKCQKICKTECSDYVVFNLPKEYHHSEEFTVWLHARGDKKSCQKDVVQIVYDIKTDQLYATKYYITLNPTNIITSKPCKLSLCTNTYELYRLVWKYLVNDSYEIYKKN